MSVHRVDSDSARSLVQGCYSFSLVARCMSRSSENEELRIEDSEVKIESRETFSMFAGWLGYVFLLFISRISSSSYPFRVTDRQPVWPIVSWRHQLNFEKFVRGFGKLIDIPVGLWGDLEKILDMFSYLWVYEETWNFDEISKNFLSALINRMKFHLKNLNPLLIWN